MAPAAAGSPEGTAVGSPEVGEGAAAAPAAGGGRAGAASAEADLEAADSGEAAPAGEDWEEEAVAALVVVGSAEGVPVVGAAAAEETLVDSAQDSGEAD